MSVVGMLVSICVYFGVTVEEKSVKGFCFAMAANLFCAFLYFTIKEFSGK